MGKILFISILLFLSAFFPFVSLSQNNKIGISIPHDSLMITGHVTLLPIKRGSKESAEGALLLFYRKSEYNDTIQMSQTTPKALTNTKGLFDITLPIDNYIIETGYLGYSYNITQFDYINNITDYNIGDIELKVDIIDDSDSFLKVTTGSKIKLFFRKVYYRLKFLL